MSYAPIVIFAYNRPDHLNNLLNSLAKNYESSLSDLYIFCDGPKDSTYNTNILKVRNIARSAEGFKTTEIIERKENFGLAKNITSGINLIMKHKDSAIILEDDIVVSKYFLRYMNEALNIYQHDTQVISITGWLFPHMASSVPDTFFLRNVSSWSWATWKRAWKLYDYSAEKLYKELIKQHKIKMLNCTQITDFSDMLLSQADGKIDSWAIQWYAIAILNNMYTLYPGRSLVINTGDDGSGTHAMPKSMNSLLTDTPIFLNRITVSENKIMRKEHDAYLLDIFDRAKLWQNNSIVLQLKQYFPFWLLSKKERRRHRTGKISAKNSPISNG
jgi:GT2 family glycosyltransferase